MLFDNAEQTKNKHTTENCDLFIVCLQVCVNVNFKQHEYSLLKTIYRLYHSQKAYILCTISQATRIIATISISIIVSILNLANIHDLYPRLHTFSFGSPELKAIVCAIGWKCLIKLPHRKFENYNRRILLMML